MYAHTLTHTQTHYITNIHIHTRSVDVYIQHYVTLFDSYVDVYIHSISKTVIIT